jgi:hypothetical protein
MAHIPLQACQLKVLLRLSWQRHPNPRLVEEWAAPLAVVRYHR